MSAINSQHGNYTKEHGSAADFSLPVKTIALLIIIFTICFIFIERIYPLIFQHESDLFYFISSSLIFFICSLCVYLVFFKEKPTLKPNKLLLLLTFILILLQGLNIPVTEPGTSLQSLMTSSNVTYFFIMVFVGPFYEEVIFRGFLFGSLCTLTNRVGGGLGIPTLVTSIVFSLYHTQYTTISAYSFEFIVAIIFTVIRIRTKGLLGPIVSHGALNLFAVIFLLCSVL